VDDSSLSAIGCPSLVRHRLRTLDAIHVASAQVFAAGLSASGPMFVSADTRQTETAAVIGLQLDVGHNGKFCVTRIHASDGCRRGTQAMRVGAVAVVRVEEVVYSLKI
jgi:hypothetical protein